MFKAEKTSAATAADERVPSTSRVRRWRGRTRTLGIFTIVAAIFVYFVSLSATANEAARAGPFLTILGFDSSDVMSSQNIFSEGAGGTRVQEPMIPDIACPDGQTLQFINTSNGDAVFILDQFPAPNDNSYGINAVGWGTKGHKFNDLVGSDKGGFWVKNASGTVVLSFNIDYVTAKSGTPSGYASLGPFGGDGQVVTGTLTTNDITWDTSLARNLNNTGYFVGGVQVAGDTDLLLNSPATANQIDDYTIVSPSVWTGTYQNPETLLPGYPGNPYPTTITGWNFRNTYFATVKASKMMSLGAIEQVGGLWQLKAGWVIGPNGVLHNSPAKTCPPSTPTPTPTNTPTFTPTNTPTLTPTNTPTNTPTFTPTNTPTFTPTNTPTFTPTNTPTNTPTFTPTNTPTFTPTNTPTFTPTNTPTFTPTNTPTFTPTNTPTFTPTATPTVPPCVPITLDPAVLPAGTVGIAYQQQITASPPGSYTYTVISGQLPPGLSLDPVTGVISGTPNQSGNYTFTVQATGGDGCFGTAVYNVAIWDQETLCKQYFDTSFAPLLPVGWTSTAMGGHSLWITSPVNPDTPPYDAYAKSAMTAGMTELRTPLYAVSPMGTQMTFRAAYNFQDGGPGSPVGMDGMVLEISINGAPFVDIMDAGGDFVTGGYNKAISHDHGSPLAGRMAWSGLSGGSSSSPEYVRVTVNLPTAAYGRSVQMRWVVASDSDFMAAGDAGARIDTIVGTACPLTAAAVEISGRVMSQDGRWISNATVTLTDTAGQVRTVRTGSFGYYRFEDLRAGETYVIGASARNHTFDPLVVVVVDDLTNVDIVSRE